MNAKRFWAGSTVMLLLLCGSAYSQLSGAEADESTARVQQEDFAARVRALNDSISSGWPMSAVRAIMGEPERVRHAGDAENPVEIWGYAGYDVRIEFRNGLVERWFVRFTQ